MGVKKMRERPVTMDPNRLGELRENALMDALHFIKHERDKYEEVGHYRKAAELDRSHRMLEKMLYDPLNY